MSGVAIKFLGSGDALGSGGRFQTCIQVTAATGQLLIDCGTSSLVAMKRFGVDPSLVDIILLSHLHGDHFGGLPFFILNAQFTRRTRPLVVAGPPGVRTRVNEAMEVLFPGSSRVQQKFAIEFVELQDGNTHLISWIKVIPYPVNHPSGAPSYALRVECDGKIIGYSGDTEWVETLTEVARGADLFISEAYFFEKRVKYHLDYQTLMNKRGQLECKRLILTHMSEDVLQKLNSLEMEWAEDGQVIDL